MTFFKQHPRFWFAVWAIFCFGGLVMAYSSVFNQSFDASLLVRGLIGLAVGATMMSYLLPVIRNSNAPNN